VISEYKICTALLSSCTT